MNEREALFVLNAVPDLGPVKIRKLLQYFGSAHKVFDVSASMLSEVAGIGKKIVENITNWEKYFSLKKEYALLEENNVKCITIDDIEYPSLLKEIYDAPIVLYIKGSIEKCDQNAIAIVGARDASYYGINIAMRFSRELASRGITIVSGGARGIDTAAHKGALQGSGRTIAVLGCGVDRIYPPENTELAEQILMNGAIISEFPIGTLPVRQNFPRRNRIISGLCRGVLVVEAGKNSGSLITARLAAEQGREVFSVPGRIDVAISQGSNVLIKNGAKPIFDIGDILEEFDICTDVNTNTKPIITDNKIQKVCGLSSSEEKIFASLKEDTYTVDEISNLSSVCVSDVWSSLVNLELKGLVKRLPGSKFVRK